MDVTTYAPDGVGGIKKTYISSPVGGVFFLATTTPPKHALVCDGSAVSRVIYAALFAAIGTTFGAGDGATTFNLPDLRGKFIRGTGGNAAALGVAQGDGVKRHEHIIRGRDLATDTAGVLIGFSSSHPDGVPRVYPGDIANMSTHTSEIFAYFNSDGTTETRPVNTALLPCIIFE